MEMSVLLQCGKCGLEKPAPLDPTDPPATARIKTLCPECAGGDFSLVDYFDKSGAQIFPSDMNSGTQT
jgi:hypothetical protein